MACWVGDGEDIFRNVCHENTSIKILATVNKNLSSTWVPGTVQLGDVAGARRA